MFNQVKFEDVYGVEFGAASNLMKYPDPDNNEFEMEINTPNHSEEDVRIAISTMSSVFFRDKMKLELWDGDLLLYESNRGFSFFINKSGIDPWSEKGTGDNRRPRIPRETHLEPAHKYRLRGYRTFGATDKNPIDLIHISNDKNEVKYGPDNIVDIGTRMTFGPLKGTFFQDLEG